MKPRMIISYAGSEVLGLRILNTLQIWRSRKRWPSADILWLSVSDAHRLYWMTAKPGEMKRAYDPRVGDIGTLWGVTTIIANIEPGTAYLTEK